MPVAPELTLTTNIAALPGVGPHRAKSLRRLGIRCVADLLVHLPLRYEHELSERSIDEASETVGPHHQSDATLSVTGEVLTCAPRPGRKPRFEATIHDGTATMLLTWFNAPWIRGQIHPGMRIRAIGKTKRWGDYLQMVNPKIEKLPEQTEQVERREGRMVPVYPGSEDVSSRDVARLVERILDDALSLVVDHFTPEFRRGMEIVPLDEAYRMIHQPRDEDDINAGRRRLVFDELLLLQLAIMMKRRHRRQTLHAPALRWSETIDQRVRSRFPFTLTPAQDAVVGDLIADLQQDVPMNRLLQGDVGAGKTVVALYAMLMAVASEQQSALMAPTELLAEQHFLTITNLLEGSRVRIELLTGSLPPTRRREIHERLAAGEIDLLIGTHALLTEGVSFKSLAVAVIDEQHRFGVHQRAHLRTKAADEDSTPHTLVMTATPIPRTLSLTIFGDLDVSTIKQLPPGRKPIATRHLPKARADEAYRFVNEEIGRGRQAYIVVPMIEESERAVTDLRTHLHFLEQGPLAGRRIAAMHGRLKRDERAMIMDRFRRGEIDALVATTVIEVGVDVPNACVMVIEDADQFGLAQLHQLRGRIGRGSERSVCILVVDPTTEDGQARIDAVVSSTDGFQIAEKDFEIRGPGEIFGARQSGIAPFRISRFPRDTDLLRLARRVAGEWIDEHPTLSDPRDELLRKRLLKAHGEFLALGDVA